MAFIHVHQVLFYFQQRSFSAIICPVSILKQKEKVVQGHMFLKLISRTAYSVSLDIYFFRDY